LAGKFRSLSGHKAWNFAALMCSCRSLGEFAKRVKPEACGIPSYPRFSYHATSCLTTSGESIKESQQTAVQLRQQILEFARRAQGQGLTINQAERLIENHKGHSISPRFAELVRLGRLVRIITGRSEPTTRFPQGAPRYWTRYDEETRRNVIVHWVPEFAPIAIETNKNSEAVR
jgi:hypothetical protein